MITSTQNERVKQAHALQTQAKARRKAGKIALEGVRLVRDALERGLRPDYILATQDVDLAWLHSRTEILAVNDEVMRHISDTQHPQGVIAIFPTPKPVLPAPTPHLLVLDSIRDPGNLGTILRAAGAAGVSAVLCSPTCADLYNPKTLRAGMGAHFRVPVFDYEWSAIAAACSGHRVYLASGDGKTLYTAADWSGAWALIIGSEAHGAGDYAHKLAHEQIVIPMASNTELLNAAIAAGVLLFHALQVKG